MSVFHGLFNNANDVFENYATPDEDRVGVVFLYAQYEYEDYSGSSGVIFLKQGKMYLVTGSHCSCYGLEDQWSPEEIKVDEIRHYIANKATPYGIDFELFKGIIDALDGVDLDTMSDEQIAFVMRLAN